SIRRSLSGAPQRARRAAAPDTHRHARRRTCGSPFRLLREIRGCLPQNLPVHAQVLVLLTQPLQLCTLRRIERTRRLVAFGLLHPRGEGTIRDPQRPRNLSPRPIRRTEQRDRLPPELLGILRWTAHRGPRSPGLHPGSGVQQSGSTPRAPAPLDRASISPSPYAVRAGATASRLASSSISVISPGSGSVASAGSSSSAVSVGRDGRTAAAMTAPAMAMVPASRR